MQKENPFTIQIFSNHYTFDFQALLDCPPIVETVTAPAYATLSRPTSKCIISYVKKNYFFQSYIPEKGSHS